jgi:long-chain fatty acid transport protein
MMNLYNKINLAHFFRTGLLLVCLFTSAAQADVGPALSGITARADDASTVFWSPAGITRIKKPELVIQSTLVAMETKFNVDESNIGGGNADKDSKILLVPGMFYAQPLKDRWSAGFSLTVPSGFGNDYGKYWSGRYLSQENELTFFALTGTVGYKFSDQWSIGGGPIIMYTDSTSKAQINNPVKNDGRIKLEEDGFGYGWQLGILHDINDSARIGAVYRAEIDPDLSGKPEYSNLSPVYQRALENLGLFGQDINVDFVVPQQVQLGYYQEFKKDWSFTLDAIWIDMSEFGVEHVSVGPDHVSLPSEFRDAFAYTTGLRYEYRSDLAFSVGAAYMTSPATDSKRSLALPLDRILAYGAGVEWHWKGLEIHSNLNYVDFGDNDIDQGNAVPLGPGRVKGSFDYNHAVILDMMFIKKF